MALPAMANESNLYFERGGPTYRLMQRIGVVKGDDPSITRRIVIFLALTWLPLLRCSSFPSSKALRWGRRRSSRFFWIMHRTPGFL